MKILLGCDVDPVLPPVLERPPAGDVWGCLVNVDELEAELGGGGRNVFDLASSRRASAAASDPGPIRSGVHYLVNDRRPAPPLPIVPSITVPQL